MKRPLLLLLFVLLAGALAYRLSFHAATRTTKTLMASPDAELAWLQRDFQLGDAEVARIRQLREAYLPVCAGMCERIEASQARLENLIGTNHTLNPELEAALRESSELRQDCQRRMLEHLYAVSAAMEPAKATRYLAMMKAQVAAPGAGQTSVAPPSLSPRNESSPR